MSYRPSPEEQRDLVRRLFVRCTCQVADQSPDTVEQAKLMLKAYELLEKTGDKNADGNHSLLEIIVADAGMTEPTLPDGAEVL